MSWNGSEEEGNVRSECEEMKPKFLTLRQWHWLVMTDRIWHILYIKCMKLTAKYVLLWANVLFFGDSSQIWMKLFSLGICVLFGGGGPSKIRVVLYVGKHGNIQHKIAYKPFCSYTSDYILSSLQEFMEICQRVWGSMLVNFIIIIIIWGC